MTGSIRACLELTQASSGTHSVHEIYQGALDALKEGLQVERASSLLFDQGGVMRFVAWAGGREVCVAPSRRCRSGCSHFTSKLSISVI